jgi:alkanesulfonate monooxygenase SsuD/methylene tetrahydromethanopterin reductase-like flavin-dependent oxidoreductase (luciferase family)
VATLDELSEGRCILGLGLHTDSMVAWTGRDTTHYMAVVSDAVALIPAAFARRERRFRQPPLSVDRPVLPAVQAAPRGRAIYVSSFGDEFHELAARSATGASRWSRRAAGARHTVSAIERGIARSRRPRSQYTISGADG